MPWQETGDFDRLVNGELKAGLDASDQLRKSAVSKFWLFMGIVVAAAVVLLLVIAGSGHFVIGMVVAIVVGVGAFIAASMPLNKAKGQIKTPIAHALAGQLGLSWVERGFAPPGFESAQRTLFGYVSNSTFGDLFQGQVDGRAFAVYDALLTRRAGKNTHTVFQGQIWRIERRPPYPTETVIVPDKGLFNFFKPRGGMVRVRFPEDQGFEKTFEAYGDNEAESRSLLSNAVREWLAGVRQETGRTFVHLQGSDIVVALWGPDRFEPGSMFKSEPGVERARKMWTDLNGAVDFGRRLGAVFPEGTSPPAA